VTNGSAMSHPGEVLMQVVGIACGIVVAAAAVVNYQQIVCA